MRRKEVIQHHPDGNLVTSYDYCPSGQIRSVTDPRDNTTATRYDSHGRPVRTLLPATDEHPATETSVAYNVLGQRVAISDQEGKLTRRRHDALGRLVTAAKSPRPAPPPPRAPRRMPTMIFTASRVRPSPEIPSTPA